jgi:hypothetical protein
MMFGRAFNDRLGDAVPGCVQRCTSNDSDNPHDSLTTGSICDQRTYVSDCTVLKITAKVRIDPMHSEFQRWHQRPTLTCMCRYSNPASVAISFFTAWGRSKSHGSVRGVSTHAWRHASRNLQISHSVGARLQSARCLRGEGCPLLRKTTANCIRWGVPSRHRPDGTGVTAVRDEMKADIFRKFIQRLPCEGSVVIGCRHREFDCWRIPRV